MTVRAGSGDSTQHGHHRHRVGKSGWSLWWFLNSLISLSFSAKGKLRERQGGGVAPPARPSHPRFTCCGQDGEGAALRLPAHSPAVYWN